MSSMQSIRFAVSCIMDLSCAVDQFLGPGETILTDQFDTGYGGKGANETIAAACSGGECPSDRCGWEKSLPWMLTRLIPPVPATHPNP